MVGEASTQSDTNADVLKDNDNNASEQKVDPSHGWVDPPKTVNFQPILDAQSKHGSIFRRELFDAVYAVDQDSKKKEGELDRDPLQPTNSRSVELLVPDIYGIEHSVLAVREGPSVDRTGGTSIGKRIWDYSSLQDLATTWLDEGPHWQHRLPYSFSSSDVNEIDCFSESNLEVLVTDLKAQWEASAFHHQLITFLDKNIVTPESPRIDKIICFGLGCFETSHGARWLREPYVQHLAAVTIREVLARLQGGPAPQVYTQEPAYCAAGKAYVQRHFGMTVLEDPEGFRALDGNTFVITISPDVPVRQIAVDITQDFGGPAGMLCNEIEDDGLHYGDESEWSTDPESPAVWAYKQRGTWFEYDGHKVENWFGGVGVYLRERVKEEDAQK